ncbi:UDP-N-acetylglucosamine 1-carboxyvinyltransferase [Candidatus Kaiserbacteria bacterium RIFCSPHIGHO2_02_FULL_55_25]|uniref:UDP-N-acetylglucosamine 1-carboxyvinyltransferase n=1 Tax=Candidatus Kaiserbacteria bacterium RIFCSPHIGHO2_02_FULL_55_25 TaxID=1798498 RepID=A0A1F6E9V3_9BACT|nr:MAG: UDP-N-acetylglucosamine 1-carboxyvinyltransferase [Candidatus Kaiserbacteria bacterium RIFCSPHIGHO2_02_FULL_55_25]OGG78695.1 MAG: UDP-N-acetylglucosamine 1-carboxyvinyltransferase [Candidatus Kaiserbacteria bacterium RIFCSPHIGHO2_12_FULL_55_13]OGG84107.1 MAG: UDP-N-acetylglucosamine 1-carboxyvinyltransferase [Candidatus Kaiserbacteria bacterium RIFCSPLOWO2_01_FULL_55_25]
MNYRVQGGKQLSGTVTTNISKNAAVALLAASLLNRGETILKRMPRIEEVKRLIEVMESIGVKIAWNINGDMSIKPPKKFDLSNINRASAEKTRSIALFIAPLAHALESFDLPAPRGCDLGKRSLGAHVDALAKLGIQVTGDEAVHSYHVESNGKHPAELVMFEASNTGTENTLMAAARIDGVSTIKFASADYMVQDLCYFLEQCGVKIDGIGTSTLVVHGKKDIEESVTGYPSEDPIESMFFFSLAATTGSELTVERCPIDVLELELLTLESMGLHYERGIPYTAENGKTRLVDIIIKPSTLIAPPEKIAARPFPGINTDNLPFFVPIATQAQGDTLIHDWMYDGRAHWYLEINKLGAHAELLDPHRVLIKGPTPLHGGEIEAPPALRPATMLLIGMLAAERESTLFNVYPINRGYENLHERLKTLGASVEAVE